ncbi:MAG: hypothetical protein D6791_07640 [Chloroflexi bacterium]|nr:MAG: hypothetical protein D6791_07640 [Chloroflexota bacterium]
MGLAVLAIILAIVGVLTGWLAPAVVNSRRPYGMGGDIAAGVIIMVVVGLIEWKWIMPIFNFPGWLDLSAAIGDPFVLTLIVLWLMRKIKPAVPESR